MPKFLIIGTPIGNLGDMSQRGIESLRSCEAILCEDTRRSATLLAHFGINGKKLVRFDKFAEHTDLSELMKKLEGYSLVGLVSDAGMPGISDPGGVFVSYLIEHGIVYEVIPGPSSLTAAIAGFGLRASGFYFGAFLPRKKKEIREELEKIAPLRVPALFFESPNRLADCLEEAGILFPGMRAGVARELTKIYEQFIIGTPGEILKKLRDNDQLRGEVVVLFDFSTLPEKKEVEMSAQDIEAAVLAGEDRSLSKRENSKVLGKKYGITSSEAYRILSNR